MPQPQGGDNSPATHPGFTCDGSGADNITQTDNMMAEVSFYAEQARNNDGFVCPQTSQEPVRDYLNIGDETSESGHNLLEWSVNQEGVPFNGSNYGGGSTDDTFRLLMGPGDGCGTGYENATFTMNAGGGTATQLTLEHLDGQVNDSFDLYVNDFLEGQYTAGLGAETWHTTVFPISPVSGTVNVKLVSTQPALPWCYTWGQVAFSNALLE